MSFEAKFLARAQSDPDGFAAAVRQRFGYAPEHVDAMLRIGERLSQPGGGQITPAETRLLQQINPSADPQTIVSVVAAINGAPAHQRAHAYLGALAADPAVLNNYDLVNASDQFRQLEDLQRVYTTNSYAEAINAKRGGDGVESRAPKREATDVRSLIESSMTHPNQRAVQSALEAGDSATEGMVRSALATKIENAAVALDSGELSARDALSASYDLHAGEAHAREGFGVGSDE